MSCGECDEAEDQAEGEGAGSDEPAEDSTEAGERAPRRRPVPPGTTVPYRVLDPDGSDPKDWPRYATYRMEPVQEQNSSGETVTRNRAISYLWLLEPSPHYERITPSMWRRYYAQRREEHRQPHRNRPPTWGPYVTCRLPVASLDGIPGTSRRLVWNSPNSDCEPQNWWDVRIYNVTVEPAEGDPFIPQPLWLPLIERTIMRIPVEHLRWTRFRTLYVDFRIGAPFGSGANVGDGGGNLGNHPRTRGIEDREVLGMALLTYSALNRLWCRSGTRPQNDDQIDAAFQDPQSVVTTFYHEFGHLLDFTDPQTRTRNHRVYGGDFEDIEDVEVLLQQIDDERAHWQAINRGSSTFDSYRQEIRYRGSTQGPSEGVAEAYKKRFSNDTLGSGTHARAVSEILDGAGFPDQDSVAEVAEAIAHYYEHELPEGANHVVEP